MPTIRALVSFIISRAEVPPFRCLAGDDISLFKTDLLANAIS